MIVIYFLDTSCILRKLLGDGPVLERWAIWDFAVASEIAVVEAARTLDRLGRMGNLSRNAQSRAVAEFDEMRQAIRWVAVTPQVIATAAGPMPTIVRALDAMHLATAIVLRDTPVEGLIFATHDRQLANAAAALGFQVEGA